MEPVEKRISRFRNGPPVEIIDTLLNSIDNYFNNEIRLTTENNNYQTSLLFLGIHAVALTIAKGLFNKTGPEGYKTFLKKFVDGDTADTKFSQIAKKIHDWRNVLAHQWLGIDGYSIGYDYEMEPGWKLRNGITFINPRIYKNCYLSAFNGSGKIWDFQQILSAEELEAAKKRLISEFLNQ